MSTDSDYFRDWQKALERIKDLEQELEEKDADIFEASLRLGPKIARLQQLIQDAAYLLERWHTVAPYVKGNVEAGEIWLADPEVVAIKRSW